MGLIVDVKKGISTVGELIEALQDFPADMGLELDCENVIKIYRVKPQKGESVEDTRGYVSIEGNGYNGDDDV